MSRFPQNIYDTINILPYGSGRQTFGRGGRVGSMRKPADKAGGGVKNWKFLRASYMDGPLLKNINYLLTKLPPYLFLPVLLITSTKLCIIEL